MWHNVFTKEELEKFEYKSGSSNLSEESEKRFKETVKQLRKEG